MSQPDAPLALANEQFSAFTGYGLSSMLGRNCRLLQRPGENAVGCDDVRRAMAAGAELQVILHDCREVGNLLFLRPVDAVDRMLRYYLGPWFDPAPALQDALVRQAKRVAAKPQGDLLRLRAMTGWPDDERRRYLADAAAAGPVTNRMHAR